MKKYLYLFVVSMFPSFALAAGYGPYQFGMTIDQVKAVTTCPAYTTSENGQGMWCENFPFEGKNRFFDFYFGPQGLMKIMVTFYEAKGPLNDAAFLQALTELVTYAEKTYGVLTSPSLADKPVTAQNLFDAFKQSLATSQDDIVKMQLKPKTDPKDSFVFASLTRVKSQDHTMISLSFQPPRQ